MHLLHLLMLIWRIKMPYHSFQAHQIDLLSLLQQVFHLLSNTGLLSAEGFLFH
nr:MAG TPA: hypothetical protein [Caudoviricetes sp.]